MILLINRVMQELIHSKKDRLLLSLRRHHRMAIYSQRKTPLLLLQEVMEKCLVQIQKQQGSRLNVKQLLEQAVRIQESMDDSGSEQVRKLYKVSCCLLLSQKSFRDQKWYNRCLLKLIVLGLQNYGAQQSNFTCRLLHLALRSLKKKAITFFLQNQTLLDLIIRLSLLPSSAFLSWIAKITALSPEISTKIKPYFKKLFDLVDTIQEAQTTVLNLIRWKGVVQQEETGSWLRKVVERGEIERAGRIVRAWEGGGGSRLLEQFSQIIFSGE